MRNEAHLKKLTQSHYDSHHFDLDTDARYMTFRKERYISQILSERHHDLLVLDIGCGVGVLSSYIKKAFSIDRLYSGDISYQSLKVAQAKGLTVLNLDNLALPFKSGIADVVVSGGVIHHTPDARKAFSELSRLIKKKGEMWLTVYNKKHPYFFLYNYIGGFFRIMNENPIGKFIANYAGPFVYHYSYYVLQVIVKRNFRPIPYRQSVNMFYDTFMTPKASFHTFEEIRAWAREENLRITASRTEVAGQMLSFRLEKNS